MQESAGKVRSEKFVRGVPVLLPCALHIHRVFAGILLILQPDGSRSLTAPTSAPILRCSVLERYFVHAPAPRGWFPASQKDFRRDRHQSMSRKTRPAALALRTIPCRIRLLKTR